MGSKTKIKAKSKKGIVSAKVMAKHPMLSGMEAKKLKKESYYITHMVAKADGAVVFEMSSSQFLSANPFLSFKYKGEKGSSLEFTWVDSKGTKDTKKVKVK